jgi:hypothetical protein
MVNIYKKHNQQSAKAWSNIVKKHGQQSLTNMVKHHQETWSNIIKKHGQASSTPMAMLNGWRPMFDGV